MTEDHITTTEAAAILGCLQKNVRKLIYEGKLTGVQAGRDWFVLRSEVVARKASNPKRGRPKKKAD